MIAVADTDILSMFGKVKSANLLKSLFHKIYVPIAVYEELLKTKEMGFSFIDEILEHQSVLKPNFYLNHKSQTQPITGSYIQKNNYFIASP